MLKEILVLLNTQSWRPSPRSEHSDTDEEENDRAEIREAVKYSTAQPQVNRRVRATR